jgi:hypothetical protein
VVEEDGGARWETKTCGARMVVTGGRKDVTAEMRNPKEMTPSYEYGKAARAEWARRGGGGLWGRWVDASGLGRLGRIPGDDSKEKLIFKFQMN